MVAKEVLARGKADGEPDSSAVRNAGRQDFGDGGEEERMGGDERKCARMPARDADVIQS